MREHITTKHRAIVRLKVLLAFLLLCVVMAPALRVKAAQPLLVDEAQVLSDSEARRLEEDLAEVSDAYNIDLVVLTVTDLEGKEAMDYADDYYDYNGYGRDADYSGALFLHCPDSRDYWISTCGRVADAVSDDAMEDLTGAVVECLRADDFAGAYETYITGVDNYMMYMEEYGVSISYQDIQEYPEDAKYLFNPPEKEKSFFEKITEYAAGNVVLAPVFGFISSFLYMGGQKRKLVSVRKQSGAQHYVRSGASRLRFSNDILVNRTMNKTPIRTERSSSFGGRVGGSTTFHTSSSGRSHGGGGGKY